MARRRKIPVRKHHGVRDPLKQLEEREKKLQNVTNNPPSQDNDQKLSYKFVQFKKIADATKAGKKIKKLKCGQEDKPAPPKMTKKQSELTTVQEKQFKPIKQINGETDEDYLKRVNRVTSESLREAQYETKYGVKVLRNPKTGEIIIQKRPKNEIDELLKQKKKERSTNSKKLGKKMKKSSSTVKLIDPKLAKELIKQAIREDEEEKRKEIKVEEYKHDVVKFGEVVHAPPTLSTLPRKAEKSETVPRPGKKDNLILKSLLNGSNAQTNASMASVSHSKTKSTKVDKVSKSQLKGKRKDLPAATRSMLESERSKIVDLYRNLKKSKVKPFP